MSFPHHRFRTAILLLLLSLNALPRPAAWARVIYDMADISGNIRIIGRETGSQLNTMVQLDFNGNGQPDIFVGGERYSSPNGVYGYFDLLLQDNQAIDLLAVPWDIWIHGDYDIAPGREITACDINADGIEDLAVFDSRDQKTVYVFYGSSDWEPGTEIDLAMTSADLTITGSRAYMLGWAMVSGDINQDGQDDLIVGGYDAFAPSNYANGAVYVFFGSPEYSSPMTIDLDQATADISIFGANGNDNFGCALALSDINSDGILDLIAGARNAETSLERKGRVYVFFGRTDWALPVQILLDEENADVTLIGPEPNSRFGWSVAAADINGDGIGDVFASAMGTDGPSTLGVDPVGSCHAVFGRTDFPPEISIDLATQPADISILGDTDLAYLGWTINAADLDGDGTAELVMSDTVDDFTMNTFVVSGSRTFPPNLAIDLSVHSPTMEFLGEDNSGIVPRDTSFFDVDGDGIDDLILFATRANALDRVHCGIIHIFFGHSPLNAPPRVLAGPGPHPANRAEVRLWDPFDPVFWRLRLFPFLARGYGAAVTMANLDGTGYDRMVIGPGPGPHHPPLVQCLNDDGSVVSAFLAYGTPRYGVNLASGDLDGDGADEIITGAGPGEVFGPHVRGWRWVGGTVIPMPGVNFMAYGTNRWGVNVAAGDIDGDGREEIVAGAGPGAVFGPHVRAWKYQQGEMRPLPGVSYLAYGTNQYGVNTACGDIDGDGIDEIVTGPGPGLHFGAHVRGWNFDGQSVMAIEDVNFFAYSIPIAGGVSVACGDIDNDGYAEILTTPGPMVHNPPWLKCWNYDGEELQLAESKSFMVFGEALYVAGANAVLGHVREPADYLP
jgi:hypothetical protein